MSVLLCNSIMISITLFQPGTKWQTYWYFRNTYRLTHLKKWPEKNYFIKLFVFFAKKLADF